MTGLQTFSDWMLAVLPRLFIYPGGLWLIAALLALRVSAAGRLHALQPRTLFRDLFSAEPLAWALAWVAVALLPLPGTTLLPFPADRLVLAALPLLSLAAGKGDAGRHAWAYVGITLAALAPIVDGSGLLVGAVEPSPSVIVSLVAMGLGLLALWGDAARDLGAATRIVAWSMLGVSTVLSQSQAPIMGMVWVSVIYTVVLAAFAPVSRFAKRRSYQGALPISCLVLAAVALLLALLRY